MRIYFAPAEDAATVTSQVTGAASQTKTLAVQPGCATNDQRSHANLCPSMDIYFTPPSGVWSVDLVLTNVFGDELERETLNVKSRDTTGIHLLGTAVCDSTTQHGGSVSWNCGDPSNLLGRTA